jgi:hypothetical protein
MDRHRAIAAPKFAVVADTLARHLAGTGAASWTVPKGGYFISLDVLDGCAKEVVRLATEAGVALTPAGASYPQGRDPRDPQQSHRPDVPWLDTVARQPGGGGVLAPRGVDGAAQDDRRVTSPDAGAFPPPQAAGVRPADRPRGSHVRPRRCVATPLPC